jgi:hypothetical protein
LLDDTGLIPEDMRSLLGRGSRSADETERDGGIPLEDVERWVKSWNTDAELPPPEPRLASANEAVEFSPPARRDLARLRLAGAYGSHRRQARRRNTLRGGSMSLGEFPERGVRIRSRLRELIVPFGSAGYVVHYEVERAA